MSKMSSMFIYLHLFINSSSTKLFTQSDFEKIFEKLIEDVESTVKAELEMFYRMSGNFKCSTYKQ